MAPSPDLQLRLPPTSLSLITSHASIRLPPLLYDEKIRLLTMHPAQSESCPLQCSITRGRLLDPDLSFETISYTWGDALKKQKISYGAEEEKLTAIGNSYNTLRYLRRRDKTRLVWIDTICVYLHRSRTKHLRNLRCLFLHLRAKSGLGKFTLYGFKVEVYQYITFYLYPVILTLPYLARSSY
jgi:Heterokaryon incompatibility protein (HET)